VKHEAFNLAVENFKEYICTQTLADSLKLVEKLDGAETKEVEIDKDVNAHIEIKRV
jgi:isoleucyl-tRNA synthetase